MGAAEDASQPAQLEGDEIEEEVAHRVSMSCFGFPGS
jgi:hypothetical protein